ncbi:MAG: hypothetical protein RIR97_2186, partial [Pseudomonadota bacterium]
MLAVLELLVLAKLIVWTYLAARERSLMSVTFAQSWLLGPMRVLFRLRTDGLAHTRVETGPRIYLVQRQSWLDAAFLLTLLPRHVDHIYIGGDDRRLWLAPFRWLARDHGNLGLTLAARVDAAARNGRSCLVYLLPSIEPSPETMHHLHMLAETAFRHSVPVQALHIGGTRHSYASVWTKKQARRHLLPKVVIGTADAIEVVAGRPQQLADQVFDRLALAKLRAAHDRHSLFQALRHAALRHGLHKIAIEDANGGKLSYFQLLGGIRALSSHLMPLAKLNEPIGLLLPNSNGFVIAYFAILSAGRIASLLNYTAGPAAISSAVNTGLIRNIITSKAFVEKAGLESVTERLLLNGTRI